MGSQESMMEAIFEKKNSPFYHFGQVMRLGRIPYDDFKEYINERMPENHGMLAEQILAVTDCHPYYTQQLSSQVWETIKYQHIKDNVVQQAVDELVRMHDMDYERMWQNLNRTDRHTLLLLSQSKSPMQERNIPSSTSYSSLLRLMKSGFVVKTQQYDLEDPFFKQWLKRNTE